MINNVKIEDYITAGAWARICKTVMSHTYIKLSEVMYAKDIDRWRSPEQKICGIISKAEDTMFDKFPDIGSEYVDVFYGGTQFTRASEVEIAVCRKMSHILLDMMRTGMELMAEAVKAENALWEREDERKEGGDADE